MSMNGISRQCRRRRRQTDGRTNSGEGGALLWAGGERGDPLVVGQPSRQNRNFSLRT